MVHGSHDFHSGNCYTFSNVRIQNNYGCHGYNRRFGYGYNRGYDPYMGTCGLHFGNRHGYGGYGYGYDIYGFTPKDYAKMYTVDAGCNLLLSGAQLFADYKAEKRAMEAENLAQKNLDAKRAKARELKLDGGHKVNQGGFEVVYYRSSIDNKYYIETETGYEHAANINNIDAHGIVT